MRARAGRVPPAALPGGGPADAGPPATSPPPPPRRSFREQSAAELLEAVYGMTGPPFLAALRDAALSAASWREAEAALFALRAVGGPVRRHAVGGGEHAAAAGAALGGAFAELCAPGGRLAAGALAAAAPARAAAAELVGAYAPWFEAAEGAPLDGALSLLLRCLGDARAARPAAAALRALCARCAGRLGGAPGAARALAGLAELAAPALAPPPREGEPAAPAALPFEDRAAAAEALASVAAALPPADAPAAAALLAAPHAARAGAVLKHGGAPGDARQVQALLLTLADEIRLIAAIVRRLDLPPAQFAGGPGAPPGAPQHPSLAVLELCWPLLGAVADSSLCRQEPGVVEAVCDVFNVSARRRRLPRPSPACVARLRAMARASPGSAAHARRAPPPPSAARSACCRRRAAPPSRCCPRCCARSGTSSRRTTSPRAC